MNKNGVKSRDSLSDLLKRVVGDGERVIIERRGKGVAALVPLEDFELLEELEDKADIQAAKKALKEKGVVTFEEYKKRLGMK